MKKRVANSSCELWDCKDGSQTIAHIVFICQCTDNSGAIPLPQY